MIVPRPGTAPELELYPIQVKLLRYQLNNQRQPNANMFAGMVGGLGGMMSSEYLLMFCTVDDISDICEQLRFNPLIDGSVVAADLTFDICCNQLDYTFASRCHNGCLVGCFFH